MKRLGTLSAAPTYATDVTSNPIHIAAAHFQARRFREARPLLEQASKSGTPNPQLLLMLAVACRETGDDPACGAALDRLLAVQPRAVRALLMKGDLAKESADDRGALTFYRRAAAEAEQQPNLPTDLRQQLAIADRWIEEAVKRWRSELEARLEAAGFGPGAALPRFHESLEILFGEKQVYFQQPTLYRFPELPQIQFYGREQFNWVEGLEAETAAIAAELEGLAGRPDLFKPYMVSNNQRPPSGYHGLVDNPEWSSLYLWSNGVPVPGAADLCPRTMAALEKVPLARMSVRAPVIMFSLLKGGARIPPHHGSTNVRLICHLPLVIPAGCGFRVGNEVREWKKGKLLVFDDTIEHEAWNNSREDRVVLIFDIWRPELSIEERAAVAQIFEALDAGGF